MNGTLKNMVVLGILVLTVLVSISFFQVQSDSNAKSRAIKVVLALAEKDAKAHIDSGEIVILAASHGWGPSEIPNLEMSLYKACVSEAAELKIFREYSDVVIPETPEEKFKRYEDAPESTFEYAFHYNHFILEHLKSDGNLKCI